MFLKSDLIDLKVTSADSTYSLKKIPGTIIATNVDDDKDIWHASNCSLALENVLTSNDKFTQHFTISLAVAAGTIYSLLLGDAQPKMSVGVDNEGNYWQLSKHVELFKEWSDCVEDDGHQLRIYGYPLIGGSAQVKEQQSTMPIVKLTEVLMASLFLNDVDLNPGNFGLTRRNNQLIAVKIDPECSFYHYFSDEETTVHSMKRKLTYYLVGEHHSKGLWENLSDNSGNFKDDLLSLLHSEGAHKEKMDFLCRFTSMDVSMITQILMEQVVANTDDLAALKYQLIEKIKQRFDQFRNAYELIKDRPFQSIIVLSEDGDLWAEEPEEYVESSSSEDSVDNAPPEVIMTVNKRKLSISNSPNPAELKMFKFDSNNSFFQSELVVSNNMDSNNWTESPHNINMRIHELVSFNSSQDETDEINDIDRYFNF